MTVALVEAGPAHAAVIAAIHNRAMDDAWTPDSVARLLAMPGAFAVLAHPGAAAEPAGLILCVPGGGGLEIASLAVLEPQRRRGLAAALLARAVEHAAAADAEALDLEVRADNGAALALYRGHGFLEVGRRRAYYPARAGRPAADAILMRLRLRQAGP
jgi:ribosomal-protein-alanine N-acetyltransferase